MSLIDPQLPKQYKNSRVLFEQNLDAWRQATEEAFATVNLNLTQLRKDAFLATYDYDNDGAANLPKSLQQQIIDLSTGSTPLGGTTSDTWTINSDGNAVILSSAGMTAVRTFLFPDASGTLVTTTATQTLSGKTFSDNIVWNSGTAFTGTLDHANTANRVYTFPDASGTVLLSTSTGQGLVPVGSLIPFYDFNALVTFDTNYFRYSNGTVLNYPASPLDGQTLPDISGRYIVGFGTDGGGDIGGAAWATAAVGNAGHTVNLQHLHTVDAHLHSGPSHSHVINASGTHTHALSDSAYAFIAMPAQGGSSDTEISYRTITVDAWTRDDRCDSVQDQGTTASMTAAVPLGGTTNAGGDHDHGGVTDVAGTNNTGTASPNTNNQLSTTQSIQPSSIRVRWIMRVL